MATQNNNELKKGQWSAEEDRILRNYVEANGPKNWTSLSAQGLLSRSGHSCCSRWHVHLKHGDERLNVPFSPEEERKVEELHARLGNKWSKIAKDLPGRTKEDVQNYWRRRSRSKTLEREKNKHITSSEPQTLKAVQSSSSSQQQFVFMEEEEPSKTTFEEDIFDTSMLFKRPTMPDQLEIEAESSLPDNATPDDFHDLTNNLDVGDNWIESSFPTPPTPPSTRDDHDTTS